MNIWMAFVIIQGSMSQPVPLVNKTQDGPAHISVQSQDSTKPDIDLDVQSKMHVDRMTGVEADTYVNVPTVSTIPFSTKEMCDAAITALQKQGGVFSVSCIQTQ